MSIEFLTMEEVESFHDDQLERHGGLAGVRDRAGLESAVATVQSTFGGQFLHGTVFEMAAAYAFHLSENQPFVDGMRISPRRGHSDRQHADTGIGGADTGIASMWTARSLSRTAGSPACGQGDGLAEGSRLAQ
jgi:hypothetical protein